MKYTTTTIERALRNSTTPAACLAAWQNNGTRRNLATLRKRQSAGETITKLRAQRLQYVGPEMSSPEADAPLLWLAGESDREIKNCWEGRKFLSHRGWYTMDDMMQETIETYAVQLHRFPELIFYATLDSFGDGFCLHLQDWEEIDFSDCQSEYDAQEAVTEAARSLIRSYDSTTERNAEEQREFYEQDQREQEIVQNKEELKTVRESARRLIRELRELCPTLGERYPAAQEAVQRTLRGLLRERRDLIEKNTKLANA